MAERGDGARAKAAAGTRTSPPGELPRSQAASWRTDTTSILRQSVPLAGAAPGIEPHELAQLPTTRGKVTVTCIDYCPEQVQVQEVQDIWDFLAHHRPEWSAVRWINIDGTTDMDVIRAFAEKYELHPLAIEDVVHLGQRPKAEDYPASAEHPGRLFVVAQMAELGKDGVQSEQVSLFLGRKTLVTFQERKSDIFFGVHQRIRTKDSRLRRSDVSFLFYCLLDAMVDRFFPILEDASRRLDELEEKVFAGDDRGFLHEIHVFKRDLTMLRRVAWPMRELIASLHRERHECLSETTYTYLRDVYDHVVQVLDLLETYRELAGALTETHVSTVSNRMNEIMKTLTVISTIFVPLTFLAGVYGMNMPIPENELPWSYPVFWLVSLAVAGGMLSWFRHRGWF
ncbi:MAG: magnesium/cobalt transporter CorA [Thermoguttaceae bacterium]|jgi:magnesium transporter|nr:magnesium/cobalt transporter CorA [Thermoguttaceae bacterium]